jgi:Mlc titration factor MtfA (ptsG expression regulator)
VGIIRRIRRSLILRDGLIPEDAWSHLVEEHPILHRLSASDLASLRALVSVFFREKTFEAADGLSLTDFMRAVISLQACLPILHLGLDWYDNWKTIVVVPDVFTEEHTEIDRAGVAHEWEEDKSGESWDFGPVLLSWKDVEASGWGDGYNVVIHEAAHRLDLLDGEVNGRPALHKGMSADEWRAVFTDAFKDMESRSKARKKRPKIDYYAADSDFEFFAVTSEYFFEKPDVLRSEYSDVYRLLAEFYKQDPMGRT